MDADKDGVRFASLRKSIAGRSQPKPLPRFAAVETLQREQNLARLAPKGRLIAAQPVEGTGRKGGQADKGACEIVGWIYRRTVRIKGAATGPVVPVTERFLI